jgi:hypothetical protein
MASRNIQYCAGSLSLAYDEVGSLVVEPHRALGVHRLIVSSSCAGWLLLSGTVARSVELFANMGGIPAEFFSEVALPSLAAWPAVGPGRPFTLKLRAPRRPRPVHWGLWRGKRVVRSAVVDGVRVARRGAFMLQHWPLRRGLWFRGFRPSWLPDPRPPVFKMALMGERL